MSNRVFSEHLNQGLDDIGVPAHHNERIEAFAKLIGVPRFKAESILSGQAYIDPALLALIADELEVSVDWLLGKEEI